MKGRIKRIITKVGGRRTYSTILEAKNFFSNLFFGKQMFNRRKAFYSSFIKENDLCYDVGANVGNRVAIFLDLGAKVIAIEPQSKCAGILTEKFKNRIEIVQKGLGAKEEIKHFYISSNSTLSTFDADWIEEVKENRFEGNSWNEVQTIPVTTLDKIIEKHGIPHFIKIDVEGFELEVLKGLNTAVNFISIEYAMPERLNNTVACLQKLKTLSGSSKCNYSIGESMKWALAEWLPIEEMITHINTPAFLATNFGDIYISKN